MEEITSPRVTALVVVRNQAEPLRQCLRALSQSADQDRLEVIVVDDGSSDGTADVADEFLNVIVLRLPRRLGWTRATNIGLRTAKGEFVLLLPPGWSLAPHAIPALADRMAQTPEAGAVCPAVDRVWNFPAPRALVERWRTGELSGSTAILTGEVSVDYVTDVPMLLRRQFLRAMNLLDERFGDRWADLELCWRIRQAGKLIVVTETGATRHSGRRKPEDAVEWADSAAGVATWIGLHYGTIAGLKTRLSMALHALGQGNAGACGKILTGVKIDGNQT